MGPRSCAAAVVRHPRGRRPHALLPAPTPRPHRARTARSRDLPCASEVAFPHAPWPRGPRRVTSAFPPLPRRCTVNMYILKEHSVYLI